ncbi:MAG: DegT/DnrJ/EryC1/StrS family aminotransferase [candidate division Zixibacteria bacterium]|nr:DegT/DnrJ/EryC1/StrS family aminotransferase [Candidatus Tariuqbacter arcticus]
MNIPFVNLKAQYAEIKDEILSAVQEVIESSAFINGKYVKAFEEDFADYSGAKHCIGVGNGTDALYIALKTLGVGPGDEVITAANSFIATSEAITSAGAKVVFVDCDETTYNIDIDLIEEKITSKTKAIIPVCLFGQPVQLEEMFVLADKYGLKVVMDAAQAHGSTYNGKPIGAFNDFTCFSFYPGKNLGAYGDAGAILSNDYELAKRARMFANHGRMDKYNHEIEGVNSRMDGIQGSYPNVKKA